VLGDAGVFEARWSSSDALGDLDVGATLAREIALTSLGAAICIAAHSEAYLLSLRRSAYGNTAWAEAVRGRLIGCVALSEATSGSDVTNCGTVARRGGSGWVVSGHKHYVSGFATASECMVFARTGTAGSLDDYSLLLVPTTARGVESRPHQLVGARASGTCMIDLKEVEVSDDRVIGEVGTGLGQVLELLRLERLWAAIGCSAVAEACFEIALGFATRRQIQGISLRRHQVIAHRLADMRTEISAAAALAARELDAARAGRLSSASAAEAKLFTTRVACRVADEAMQILGGAGYTEATSVAQIWRDLRLSRIGGGTDEVLRELIARSVRRGPLSSLPAIRAAAFEADPARAPASEEGKA
jgi:alkylation response protein AidB-like acyl-CoA dehydrogenase